MMMANNLELVLLNGSIEGNRPGEFTFTSSMGASTIDYILVSKDLITPIIDFEVGCRTQSDHFPLLLAVNFGAMQVFANS